MDGVEKTSERIFILAATNRPNAVDPAFRRPGRFDREFEIGIPDAVGRLDILGKLLSKVPNSLVKGNIEHVNSMAHGYVGADLAALVRQGAVHALERLKKELGPAATDQEIAESDNLRIVREDLLYAMSIIRPSVVRQVTVEVPKVYWDEIGGQTDIKEKMKEAVEWPLKHPEVFARFNIKPPKGILLYGPPGCSKTLMAKALATESGLNFLAVKGPELFSKWVGDSEKAVRDIFKKARAASPSIIFFVRFYLSKDEIDSIAQRRAGQDASVADRVLSQLLAEMDGIEPLVNVTIIAATNRPDIIDSALLRPGRIDSMLYVAPPNHASRISIFKIRFSKMPIGPDVDVDRLGLLTDGYSGAETVAVCQDAGMNAMEESMNIEHVSMRHFEQAIANISPRITDEMIAFYDKFRAQSGLRVI